MALPRWDYLSRGASLPLKKKKKTLKLYISRRFEDGREFSGGFHFGSGSSRSEYHLSNRYKKQAHAYTFKHACSGHKRRRGSVQPSSSRAGKKSKSEIDRDYRERKKVEDEKLKAKTEELEKSNSHLEGQAFQLRMDLKETREEMKETREENINLKIVQKSQSESIRELGKELIASGEKINGLKEEHAQKIDALKGKHEHELLERDRKFNALSVEHDLLKSVCTMCHIDLGKWLGNSAGEMNNPTATPATAQASTS